MVVVRLIPGVAFICSLFITGPKLAAMGLQAFDSCLLQIYSANILVFEMCEASQPLKTVGVARNGTIYKYPPAKLFIAHEDPFLVRGSVIGPL